MSATPAAQLARLKLGHPGWVIERLDSGWFVARRGAEEIVVPTLAELELRLNKLRKGAAEGKSS
jgi:hypothetical protein